MDSPTPKAALKSQGGGDCPAFWPAPFRDLEVQGEEEIRAAGESGQPARGSEAQSGCDVLFWQMLCLELAMKGPSASLSLRLS